jgi:hypothetical protein
MFFLFVNFSIKIYIFILFNFLVENVFIYWKQQCTSPLPSIFFLFYHIWACEVTLFGDVVHHHPSQTESVFCYKVTFPLDWSHYQPCLIFCSKKSGSLLCSLSSTKFCLFCIGLYFVFNSIGYEVFADVRG